MAWAKHWWQQPVEHLILMHEVIQCYWDKLMNPELVMVLFEPVTRRCSLMAYSGWTKPNNLSPIVRKNVKTGENAWPNSTANVSRLQMLEWGNCLGLSWGLMGFVDAVLTSRQDRQSSSALFRPSMLSLKENTESENVNYHCLWAALKRTTSLTHSSCCRVHFIALKKHKRIGSAWFICCHWHPILCTGTNVVWTVTCSYHTCYSAWLKL